MRPSKRCLFNLLRFFQGLLMIPPVVILCFLPVVGIVIMVRDEEGRRSTWLNTSKRSIWRSQYLGLPLSFWKMLLGARVEDPGG